MTEEYDRVGALILPKCARSLFGKWAVFRISGTLVLWIVIGLMAKVSPCLCAIQARITGKDNLANIKAVGPSPSTFEESESIGREMGEIEANEVDNNQDAYAGIEHRLSSNEERIKDVERIIGPLQNNIMIFLAVWSLVMAAIGVLVGLGAKAGFAWFRARFQDETRRLNEKANKEIENAVSGIRAERKSFIEEARAISAAITKTAEQTLTLIDDKENQFGEVAKSHIQDTIDDLREWVNILDDFVGVVLEGLATYDKSALQTRDVLKALRHIELGDTRDVCNGCLDLQNFHGRGYPGTVLALTRLYRILRKWIEIEEKAKTENQRKEAKRVVREIDETIQVLKAPGGHNAVDKRKNLKKGKRISSDKKN